PAAAGVRGPRDRPTAAKSPHLRPVPPQPRTSRPTTLFVASSCSSALPWKSPECCSGEPLLAIRPSQRIPTLRRLKDLHSHFAAAVLQPAAVNEGAGEFAPHRGAAFGFAVRRPQQRLEPLAGRQRTALPIRERGKLPAGTEHAEHGVKTCPL